jgi:hypothetical protein
MQQRIRTHRSHTRVSAEKDRIQVIFFDQPIEVDVCKSLASVGVPMAQQPRLDVLQGQRFAQQRIGLQLQHPQAKVEARPPIGVDFAQLVGVEG